jgi:ERF superfamily
MNPPDTLNLAAEEEKPLSLARKETETPSIVGIIQTVIDRGVTADNVAALERLVSLYERMQDKDAEKQFASAFVALQKEMPEVHATKSVPDKQGNVKFRFAPYEEIMSAVKPMLEKHGFTVTFSMDFKEGRVIQTCTLMHIGGHSRSNQFMARIGNGPPGASECQADGAASTYAKRFALCNALNITVEMDTDGQDARSEGEPISDDKAQYLRELVRDTKSDEAAFLRYAGAATYEEIGSAKYDMLVKALLKKIQK